MAGTYQQQIGQDRNAKRLLDASLFPADLVCTQSQVGLEFPIDLLYGPSALIGTDHLSRNPFVQIGHQDFCMFWAGVTPSFTQYHGDVTDVPQAQACAKYPDTIFCMKSSHFWYTRYRSEQLSSLTKRQSEREHSQ